MTIPIRLMEYARSWNIGDEIQTLAIAQHLPRIDGFVDRDELSGWSGDPFALVMQGWFTKDERTFPHASQIRPVWLGFHLSEHVRHILHRDDVRSSMRDSGPIGCRDARTVDLLTGAGIDAFVSGCMTTTFPKRDVEPTDGGRVYLVDTTGVPLPEHLRGPDSVRVTHQGAQWWSQDAKRTLARDLLEEYRLNARLVVTTRLHCALPCVAMGIPVVFVGDMTDSRLSPIQGLAEVISFPHELRTETAANRVRRRSHWLSAMRDRNWDGFAKDIESAKARRIRMIREGLQTVGALPSVGAVHAAA
jgi:hypothetical protein